MCGVKTVGNLLSAWMVLWCCSSGLGPASQETLTKDASQCVASLGVLVLHLGRVFTAVQVPRYLSRDRSKQGVKEPDQGAYSSQIQTPAHTSQEQATTS